MKTKIVKTTMWVTGVATWIAIATVARAQLYFTNNAVGAEGLLWSGVNWTNQSGVSIVPGTTAGNWAGSNLVFNTAGINTNNVGAGATFRSVTWLADVTNRQSAMASRFYFTGFTNQGNNTVLWNMALSSKLWVIERLQWG